jgi:hypothetical protein
MSQVVKQKTKKDGRDIRAEALKIARSIQVEGQTNADTKAIATGVQRGMEMFLRQQSEKSRDLDKRLKKAKLLTSLQPGAPEVATSQQPVVVRLPWVLLGLSWVIFVGVAALAWRFIG